MFGFGIVRKVKIHVFTPEITFFPGWYMIHAHSKHILLSCWNINKITRFLPTDQQKNNEQFQAIGPISKTNLKLTNALSLRPSVRQMLLWDERTLKIEWYATHEANTRGMPFSGLHTTLNCVTKQLEIDNLFCGQPFLWAHGPNRCTIRISVTIFWWVG